MSHHICVHVLLCLIVTVPELAITHTCLSAYVLQKIRDAMSMAQKCLCVPDGLPHTPGVRWKTVLGWMIAARDDDARTI